MMMMVMVFIYLQNNMEDEKEILLKPGQSIKPHVPFDVASLLVKKLFNLEITSIKELNSYDDKNFHITV